MKIPGLPFTVEEVKEDERLRRSGLERRKAGDGRVCLCGHPFNRHTELRGVVLCQPTRMSCSCRDKVAALEVQDTRMFLRKTVGFGIRHALTLGMIAAIDAGHEIRWLIETGCSQCGAEDAFPVGLRRGIDGVRVVGMPPERELESPEATRLLCDACMRAVGS